MTTATVKTISSQRYLDDDIVAAKLAAEDYDVFVSPDFEYDGETFRVVLDGHHSLAAAKHAGVEPEITELSGCDHDAICLLRDGEIQRFLEATYNGDCYYDTETGVDVW